VRRLPLLLLPLLLAACGSGGSDAKPAATPSSDISGVKAYTGLSHQHLTKGQYPQSYDQSPPVGGRHSPAWLKCQAYDTELPKENAVHSLEHGGVWITYRPGLPAAQVATLTGKTILNKEFVMVSPYTGQSSPVVVSTWGLQLAVDSVDDPRIDAFVRAYAGGEQGGEKGVGCATTGVTLEKALEFDASQK
jgi:hypothetical protein